RFIAPHANRPSVVRVVKPLRGDSPPQPDAMATISVTDDSGVFNTVRPRHSIIPFLARRKAMEFDQNINSNNQDQVRGTFANLYSRIDLLATIGHPRHSEFQQAVCDIIGLQITTKASPKGKTAGFYLNQDHFVTLDRMGDGVTEMVGLILELCLERNKIFVLEEPETNLHPKGLKALLGMIRSSAANNQFIVATHSNIVVRELGSDDATKVFRVHRDEPDPLSPSRVEEISKTPAARMALLRELGYEFADLDLHEGWLFLEEASAETIIRDVLIPNFTPDLEGRLRTFSAAGVSNVEPSVAEFQRLTTFVHLQPAYEGRLWIRVDGGPEGERVVAKLREKFRHLDVNSCTTFSNRDFEQFYPNEFEGRVTQVLQISGKYEKRAAKAQLLNEVISWTNSNGSHAKRAWEESAAEPIALLKLIEQTIGSP
ncbi:MAG TPA: AAA family ATPase, partial [Micropepsaceae bacterium]|nr:AAA family ATPase [Micropepsaceae bacterium]